MFEEQYVDCKKWVDTITENLAITKRGNKNGKTISKYDIVCD